MKLTITGGLLEHLRDALDDVVEGNAPALVGLDLKDAELDVVCGLRPYLTITSKDRQDAARYRARVGYWERLHSCDDCGREDWSEHADWSCNCVVEPARNDPDGWRE